ncbi:MAG: hypothetical protein FWG42_01465 [Clostridiales bacterium]|nr:hypothetical protein [Clostridiales bacterium]
MQEVYCTNLLKCFTDDKPEEMEKVNKGFMTSVFSECSELLEQEIKTLNPKLIIGLSETVLKMLLSRYSDKKMKMKNANAKAFMLTIDGLQYPFVPCVHLARRNSLIERHYFPSQTEKLELLAKEQLW